MPRKKKPAANPARGFATTSVASKPKAGDVTPQPELQPAKAAVTEHHDNQIVAHQPQGALDVRHDDGERATQDLSPEELEQRLQDGELQVLVDKYAAKALKESSRHVNKLTTDCRVLRSHAQHFILRRLLPNDLLDRILTLATEDVLAGRRLSADVEPARRLKANEDDAIYQLWILQSSLLTLGFNNQQTQNALQYILSFPPTSAELGGLVWGLEECLDWLILTLDEDQLPQIDDRGVLSRGLQDVESLPDTPRSIDTPPERESAQDFESQQVQLLRDVSSLSSREVEQFTVEDSPSSDSVSDLDSDMDPDEMLAAYVSAKLRLFELEPGLDQGTSKKNTNKVPTASTPTAQKLLNKIKSIESDMLFDRQEAEQKLQGERNHKAREAAQLRKLQLPLTADAQRDQHGHQQISPTRLTLSKPQEKSTHSSDEEDSALADLFASDDSESRINGTNQPASGSDGKSDSSITIRDFGLVQGLTPWRVLEEACRARDPRCEISFQQLSRSAFSNRHSVTITWSQPHPVRTLPVEHSAVMSSISPKSHWFTMKTIATPDAQQSKAYISTFALFQIFCGSPKEEKAYLRLPSAWRDFWASLAGLWKEQTDAGSRETVRVLQSMVRECQIRYKDLDDAVSTKSSMKHSAAFNGEASNAEDMAHSLHSNPTSEELIRRWDVKCSSPGYLRMLIGRRDLPIYHFRDTALDTIRQNQITILCGETGCGKSTQMPSFILEHEMSRGSRCKIYCTEPRKISAITLAQRVCEELGEHKQDLGSIRSLVGYVVRLDSKISYSTRLVYATTGIVLRMLESPQGVQDITHVIIDEVHERSIETDFLLIILKSLLKQRPDLKVILMSATVNAQRFSAYFNGAPIITVPGRTFPVDTRFLEDAIELTGHTAEVGFRESDRDVSDHDEHTGQLVHANHSTRLKIYSTTTRDALAVFDEYRIDYELIIKLINIVAFEPSFQTYNKAILVFLPGLAEIRRLNNMIQGTTLSQRFIIHMLHSTIGSDAQQAAFTLPSRGLRKIVLSTNIAETGVTIPDITCVIDSGKHKEMRFDERRQISRLVESFISRANAKQRRGRAGRVQQGLCFHLFTMARHDETMADSQTPEMLRLSLQDLVMRVKICKLGDIQSTLADTLDPPLEKNVRRAIDTLIDIGALDSSENLTPLGLQLSKLPLDPYLGKLVLFGSLFGCLDVCLTTAAILTSRSPFIVPVGARTQLDAVRQHFKAADSDLLTDFNAYAAWRRISSGERASASIEAQFCRKNLMSLQTLCNIEDLKAQLLSALEETGLVSTSNADKQILSRIQNSAFYRTRQFVSVPRELDLHAENAELVTSVIAWSFYPKLLTRDGKGWRNIATNQIISIHPTSVLRAALPMQIRCLSFYSILQSGGSKQYNASSLTPVDAFSLLLLAGDAQHHSVAHVISIDGARLRFAIDSGKAFVACKYLRRRLNEFLNNTWKNAASEDKKAGAYTRIQGSPAEQLLLGMRLKLWINVWNDIVSSWVDTK